MIQKNFKINISQQYLRKSSKLNATKKIKNSKMLKGQLILKGHLGVLSKSTDLKPAQTSPNLKLCFMKKPTTGFHCKDFD